LVEDEKGGKLCCLTAAGVGDQVTQFGVAASIDPLEAMFDDEKFWDNTSAYFHNLKHLGSFFPVRRKLKNYVQLMTGTNAWVPDFTTRLVKYETRDQSEDKDLNSSGPNNGVEVMQKYTGGDNWYCTRINLLMATDMIKDSWALYARDLKSCIGWQTPKYSGLVYRGALHSPLEIFIMSFKRQFYIPSFTSTTTNPEILFMNIYPEKDASPIEGYQNIIFEINTSEYPNFTTLVQTHQQKYAEEESILSCYNIYSWQGFRVINWVDKAKVQHKVGVVSLKIDNYEEHHDLDNQRIRGIETFGVDETWIGKRGEIARTRNVTPEMLCNNLGLLWDSYQRNFGKTYPLNWLNTSFKVVGEELPAAEFPISPNNLVRQGRSLHGADFRNLEAEQARAKVNKQ